MLISLYLGRRYEESNDISKQIDPQELKLRWPISIVRNHRS